MSRLDPNVRLEEAYYGNTWNSYQVAVGHFWWRREAGVRGNVKTELKSRKVMKGIST